MRSITVDAKQTSLKKVFELEGRVEERNLNNTDLITIRIDQFNLY